MSWVGEFTEEVTLICCDVFKYADGFVPGDPKTNIFLATFTKAHARLWLYDVLQKLGESVLYFDTDSIIYKSDTGVDLVQTGDYLGDLTDELGGHHIIELVCGGPKNYAYKLENGECHCKIKGFTLNHTNSQVLNFEKMRPNTSIFNPRQIRHNPIEQRVFSRVERKRYQVVYTKRRVLENFNTLPYGC